MTLPLLIAKFLLPAVFVAFCSPSGILASQLSNSSTLEQDYRDLLIEGYVRSAYGFHVPKGVRRLIGNFGAPRRLPTVTARFPSDDFGRVYMDMGKLLKEWPLDLSSKKYEIYLCHGSPTPTNLLTSQTFADWGEDLGYLPYAAFLRHPVSKSDVQTFARRWDHAWRLGPLVLVVYEDTVAVAYATVDVGPLPIDKFVPKYVGEKKLEIYDQPSHYFPVVTEDFALYITEGWPDDNAKSSLTAFHDWYIADAIELKLRPDLPRPASVMADLKLEKTPGFENGEKITLVFEDKAQTIVVFSEGIMHVPVREPEVGELKDPITDVSAHRESKSRDPDTSIPVHKGNTVKVIHTSVAEYPSFWLSLIFVYSVSLLGCFLFPYFRDFLRQLVPKNSGRQEPNVDVDAAHEIEDMENGYNSNRCCTC
eukprot:993288_1